MFDSKSKLRTLAQLFKAHHCFYSIQACALVFPALVEASIDLEWDDNSDNETGFIVERRDVEVGGGWELLVNLPTDSISYTDTTAISGSEYEYRVYAYNDAGSSEYSNQVNGISSILFSGWLATYFSPSQMADPEITGNDKDPDNDGITNIVEYALGTDPTNSLLPQFPRVVIDTQGADLYAGLEFTRVSYVEDINYVVMQSSDLNDWSEIARSNMGGAFEGPATISETGAKIKTTRVIISSPLEEMPQFFRLDIEN